MAAIVKRILPWTVAFGIGAVLVQKHEEPRIRTLQVERSRQQSRHHMHQLSRLSLPEKDEWFYMMRVEPCCAPQTNKEQLNANTLGSRVA